MLASHRRAYRRDLAAAAMLGGVAVVVWTVPSRAQQNQPTVRFSVPVNAGPDRWHFHDVYVDDSGIVYDPMQGYKKGVALEQWLKTPHENTPFPDSYRFRPLDIDEVNALIGPGR
jgi:hypothetical protein